MEDTGPKISELQKTFELYYDRYWDYLVSFSANFIKDRNLAEDVVQEVFQSFWEKLEHLEDWNNLESYLYSSTKNRTINAIKKNSQRIFEHALSLADYDINTPMHADSLVQDELVKILHDAIAELPDRRRIIFKMKVFQRFSNDEISHKLGISIYTVKSQFTKALAYVRGALAPHL
ncbi:MAG: RNA polymerase sigma-70 factor [Cytophagales bacterium]|nr:RNA polymerase sigma-70 factor [Cytophagales bacterium]